MIQNQVSDIKTNVRIKMYSEKPSANAEMIAGSVLSFCIDAVVKMRFFLALMTAKYVVSCEKRGYIVLIIGCVKYYHFFRFIFAIIFRFNREIMRRSNEKLYIRISTRISIMAIKHAIICRFIIRIKNMKNS